MSRTKAKNIIVEFDDGSRAEAPFETLPTKLQLDILRQPFASKPSPEPENEKFVLLEWEDGWKEVMEVDADCTEINRYYVISRPEDVGRLSLNKQDGYPELIEVVRRPLGLQKIAFVNTFRLALEQSDREGKKTDHFFSLKDDGDGFAEALKDFKALIAEEALDLEALEAQDPEKRTEQYERIAQKMGIRAASRQQDLLDFISCLVKAAQ
jgi:hypothetical protein